MRSSPPTAEWFRRHFTSDYPILYPRRDRKEARHEVGFLVRALGLAPSSSVLDLCCGTGRHLEALREHGIVGTGIDLSPWLLEEAARRLAEARRREASRGREPLPESDLVLADMRALPFAGAVSARKPQDRTTSGFDAVLSFFTSFGYFDTAEDHSRAAAEIARVLEPGGRFSIDLFHPEATVRELVPRSEREHGNFRIVEERWHDSARRRLEKNIRLEDLATGEVREYFESVHIFDHDEISALLAKTGLTPLHTYGDFDGRNFDESSPRMILCGHKEA